MIITQARFYILTLLGALFAQRQHIPLVHTEHGSTHIASQKRYVNAILTLHDHTIGKYIIGKTTLVTTVSPSASTFVKHLGGRNIHIVPNGVDTHFFSFAPKIPGKKRVIGYSGRLEEGKGVQDLIQAVQSLRRRDIELHIAGGGSYLETLKRLVNGSGSVRFRGVLDRGNIRNFYREIDVLVVPSRQPEGLPTTILEGFATGVPTVGTATGGIMDLIKHDETGLLAAPGDPTKLAEAIQKMITLPDPTRLSMIQRARLLVERQYDWDRVAETFVSFIKKIL